MAGGTGGNGVLAPPGRQVIPGGAGGTGVIGDVGLDGQYPAGGGGGGAGGGSGGIGGKYFSLGNPGGLGGTASNPDGQNGANGIPGEGGSGVPGGGGGGGGYNGNGAGTATIRNTTPLTGGNGGDGGDGDTGDSPGPGGGGGGGAGGYGAIVTGTWVSNNSSTIKGGDGGDGGRAGGYTNSSAGDGGDGGVGVQFTAAHAIFANTGTVAGGNGGDAGGAGPPNFDGTAGHPGAGGVGIIGAGLTIVDSGKISGGLGGDGVTRADAIDFTGGINKLELDNGATIIGNVVAFSSSDTLALGGTGTGTFDVSLIGAQYQGFGHFEKTGSGTWTLIDTTTAITSWLIDRGTLAISSDGNLGNAVSVVTLDGGTLQFLAGFTTDHAITINSRGGVIDTSDFDVTLAGAISGPGELTKIGNGTLILSHANASYGGTALDGGTLDIAALGAAGSRAITFGAGSQTLMIENAALSHQDFKNAISGFGQGDVIDLTGLAFQRGATASYNAQTHLLTVTSNGVTDTLHLGLKTNVSFVATSDDHGGTEVTLAGVLHDHML